MRKKRPVPPPVSNLMLGFAGGLLVVTLGILGGLFYSLRSGRAAAQAKLNPPPQLPVTENVPQATSEVAKLNVPADDDAPVIRVAMRSSDAPPATPAVEIQPKSVKPAAPEPVAAPEREPEPSKLTEPTRAPSVPTAAKKEGSSEMVPEITGLSYTAKKALANGGDPNAVNKPPEKAGKKPEAKKVPPPAPPVAAVPPKTPAKPEPPKSVPPKTEPPKLPPMDTSKIDISKAPVYVLQDGRRIRALTVREMGSTITVKNEAGNDITFKKTDVKEILRG